MRSTLLMCLLVAVAAAAPTALPDEDWTDWPDKRDILVRGGDGRFSKTGTDPTGFKKRSAQDYSGTESNGDPTGFKERSIDHPGTEDNGDPTGYGKRSAQSDDPNWTDWLDKRDNDAPPTNTKPIGWPPKRDVLVDIA